MATRAKAIDLGAPGGRQSSLRNRSSRRLGEDDRRELHAAAGREAGRRWIASATSAGVPQAEVRRGPRARASSSGPRPSALRAAAPRPASPTSSPPPQSPLIAPRAGKRACRPSGPTPMQLRPAPQTIATPHPALGTRPQDGEGVIGDGDASRPVALAERVVQRPLLLRQVGARDQDLADIRHRLTVCRPARRAVRHRRRRSLQHLDAAIDARAAAASCPGPRTAARTLPSSPHERQVGLRVAAVDGESHARAHRKVRSGTGNGSDDASAAARVSSSRPAVSYWPISGWASSARRARAGCASPQPRQSAAHRRRRAGRAPEARAPAAVGSGVGPEPTDARWAARRRRRGASPGRVDPFRISTSWTSPVSANREPIRAVAASL